MTGRFNPSLESIDVINTVTPPVTTDYQSADQNHPEENNIPDTDQRYENKNDEEVGNAIASLEDIREDLTGTFRDKNNIETSTEFVVDVILDDESKALLDSDLAPIIEVNPEIMGSLESIALCDERSVRTLISILDQKIEELKNLNT